MRAGWKSDIRNIRVPLTERILEAHSQDLREWAEKAKEQDERHAFLARLDRLAALFKREKAKAATAS